MTRHSAAVVVVAAGSGRRIGGDPKQLRPLGGRPMLEWSCARFRSHPTVGDVVVVLPSDLVGEPPAWLERYDVRVAAGGATRRASVHAGLAALGEDPALAAVLIHDAARPFVSAALVDRLAAEAPAGPVVPVVPLADTIKRMRARADEPADLVEGTLERDRLRGVQTPQGFPLELIRRLHDAAALEGLEPTDDAWLCERAGIEVRGIPGERRAWKVTHPDDLEIADWLASTGRVEWPGGRA